MQTRSKPWGLVLLGVVGGVSAAGAWQAPQWQALFDQIPAPPTTLAQAGADAGLTRNVSNNVDLSLHDPALLRSRANWHAGMDAINQAAVDTQTAGSAAAGIDVKRMRSDPTYAQQMQEKMASMSQAEKMQMAMQMAAAQRQSQQALMANPAGLRAGGNLMAYVAGEGGQQLGSAEAALRTQFASLISHYDARHAALEKQLSDALKACPAFKGECGDTDCGPEPACVATLNARVPATIAEHRKLAAAELADEGKLFTSTRGAMQTAIAKLAKLSTAAENAGTPAAQCQSGYTAIANGSARLQSFVALVTLRAAFWQNIQQKTIPADYYAANVGTLGFQYRLGTDEVTEPPTDLPKNW